METPARLTVDVARLREGEPERLRGTLPAALLGIDDLEQIRPAGDWRHDLTVTLLPGGELLARGTLEVPCACVCARCGADFGATFAEPDYCETFDVAGKDSLDLTESAREAILLALPSYPICREGCLGVCPRCGQNLNEGPCECPEAGNPSPWGALDELS